MAAQIKDVTHAVGRDLIVSGQRRHRQTGQRIVLYQTFKKRAHDIVVKVLSAIAGSSDDGSPKLSKTSA